MSLQLANWQDEGAEGEQANGEDEGETSEEGMEEEEADSTYMGEYAHRQIDDFFNIREAIPDVRQGQWEFELEMGWITGDGTGDDDITLSQSIKYGILDELFLELEVLPLNFGDGGEVGNGELGFKLFWQFLEETDALPSAAFWSALRLPTGEGSSGIDASFNFSLTKQVCSKVRGHMGGYVMTANGERGNRLDDRDGYGYGDRRGYDRQAFQWGVGAGLDYEIAETTMATLNYLHRSSNFDGNANLHILEAGLTHQLAENQALKIAFDVGADGVRESPDFGARLQWSLQF